MRCVSGEPCATFVVAEANSDGEASGEMRSEYVEIAGLQPLSRLVLGGRFGEQDETLSFELLDTYTAFGGNVLDTANAYADGGSERLIGRWLRSSRNRERVALIDKGCHPTSKQSSRVTPRCIHEDISQSLERLQSSYIDLFLLHRDDPNVKVGSLIEALNEELVGARIRAFGASNWSHERMAEANAYARKNNLAGFSASSCGFSLAVPKEPMWPGALHVGAKGRSWHRETGLSLLAWSSQARGWFSGAYVSGQRHDADVLRVYDSAENRERRKRAEFLAGQKRVTSHQIALAYVLNQPFPTLALIGPESAEELYESTAALKIRLSKEDINYLEGNLEA